LSRDVVFATNVVHCRPPNNRTPRPVEVQACSKWLDIELGLAQPQIIIALGATAIARFLGPGAGTVEHLHGKPVVVGGRIILPAYHPAAALHDTDKLRQCQEDFEVLRGLVKGRPVSDYIVTDEYPNPVYTVVDTDRKMKKMLDEVRDVGECAIDTESVARGTKLWSVQVSAVPGTAWFIPMKKGYKGRVDVRDWGATIIVHHYLHDIEWLDILDGRFVDTMTQAYLLNLPQGLKALASRLCGIRMIDYKEVVRPGQLKLSLAYLDEVTKRQWPDPPGIPETKWDNKAGCVVTRIKHPWHISRKANNILKAANDDSDADLIKRWESIAPEERAVVESALGQMPESTLADIKYTDAVEYAARDAQSTLRVKHKMDKMLTNIGLNFVQQMDLDTLPLAREMMRNGMPVDMDHFRNLSKEYTARMGAKAAELAAVVGHSFNPNSSNQVATVVYSELGFKPTSFTPTKEISTDDQELKKTGHPVAKGIIEYRRLSKMKGTYCDNLVKYSLPDERGQYRIHTTIKTTRVATGRWCIAAGTLVDIARDISITGLHGVPIEQVKAGDWAYTYDDNLDLTLNKVLWAGKTGHKKVVRVHWLGAGRKERGFVDLTPDHKVRLVDGQYVEARNLVPWRDHVLALSRDVDSDGYARLYITGKKNAVRENRVVAARFKNIKGKHVHHDNANKLDNRPSNLLNAVIGGHLRLDGIRHRHTNKLGVAYIERSLFANGAFDPLLFSEKPTVFRDKYAIAYRTVQRYLKRSGIDFRDIKKFFNRRGEFLSRERVESVKKANLRQADEQKAIGLGFYRWRWIQSFYGFVPHNHDITAVEVLDDPVDVYDLEVETTHNLIANGICVSNSSGDPVNLQNIPVRSKEGKAIRIGFIAGVGWVILEGDLGQIEMCTMAHLSNCKGLIDLFLRGDDPHTTTAAKIFGVPYEEAKQDKYRYPCKRAGFGIIYLIGASGLRDQITEYLADLAMDGTPTDIEPWSEEQCQNFINDYYKLYPEIKDYQIERAAEARRKGYVQDMFGRIRYIPEVFCPIRSIQEAGARQAGNMPVTSCLPADTCVTTRRGWLPIGEFVDGTDVWTGEHWSPADRLFMGTHPRVRLHLSDGRTFDCDNNHKLLVQAGPWSDWKNVLDIQPDEILVQDWSMDWGLPIGETEDWYWAGRFIGDGWISGDNAKLKVWGMSFGGKEVQDGERLARWLDSKEIGGNTNSVSGYNLDYDKRHNFKIRGGTQAGYKLWQSLGSTNSKAGEKRIPPVVFTLDYKRRLAYLQGYSAARGIERQALSRNRHSWCISSASRKLLEDTVRLAQSVGYSSWISAPKTRTYDWKGRRPPTTSTLWHCTILLNKRSVTISRTELLPAEPMYTLSVDDERHAFATEGLISKNSAQGIIKMAMGRLWRETATVPWRDKMEWSMQIHDSLLVRVSEEPEILKACIAWIRDAMTSVVQLRVPVKVDFKVGKNWAVTEKYKL
jgi:DNA polymerase I-like protein with 3'-5' exonuclease and polymerase domains